MKRLLSLILTQLNMNFGISHSRYYYLKRRERLWEPLLIAIGVGFLVVMVGFGIFRLASASYAQLALLGQGNALLTLGILLAQIVVLVLGFVLIIAVFYFSNDLSLLIPLPLTPGEVLASKFAVILANEYVGSIVFLFPVFLAYAVNGGASGFLYWFSAALVFLALPVIPLVLAAIPAILFMRVTHLSARKDTLLMIAGFLFMILAIGFQFFISTNVPKPGEEDIFLERILSTTYGLVELIGAKFPPSIWATKAVAEAGRSSGLAYLLLFLGLSGAGVWALFAIGKRTFYEGVLSGFEAGAKRRRKGTVGDIPLDRFASHHPILAIALTEIKNFMRTPVFVLNGFAGFVMFPAMLILFTVIDDPQLTAMWDHLYSIPGFEGIGTLVMAGYLFILVSFSSIPFTTFSREGRHRIWVPRSLPLDGRRILVGRVAGAEIMVILGSIPGVAILEYLLRLPLIYFLAGVMIGILASIMYSLWGVLLDMARPMLNWTDQQKAIKSNLNTVFGMVGGIALTAGFGALASFLLKVGFSGLTTVIFMAGAVGVALILSWNIVGLLARRIWDNIEI